MGNLRLNSLAFLNKYINVFNLFKYINGKALREKNE